MEQIIGLGLLVLLVNLVMVWQIRRHPQAPFTRPVVAGFLVILPFLATPLVLMLQGKGPDTLALLDKTLQDGYASAVPPAGFNAEEWSQALRQWKWFLKETFPALVTIVLIGWLTLNAFLLRWLLVRMKKVALVSPVLRWRVPPSAIWALLVPGFVLLGWDFLAEAGKSEGLAVSLPLNALVLVLPAYLLQGTLVAQWMMLSWGVTPAFSAVIWVLMLLAMRGSLAASLAILGLLDNWFDFRKKKKQVEP